MEKNALTDILYDHIKSGSFWDAVRKLLLIKIISLMFEKVRKYDANHLKDDDQDGVEAEKLGFKAMAERTTGGDDIFSVLAGEGILPTTLSHQRN